MLSRLLDDKKVLLADGATGTNLFMAGLESGEPPEFWTIEHPDRIERLHQGFVDAGADIILTNTFGGNARRLRLHKAEGRVGELNAAAAAIARRVADKAGRPVVVAGSVGPTGDLFEPLGDLTAAAAVKVFSDQVAALKAGGVDVIWIETMSAFEEMQAAAEAAALHDMPFTITASFDTAGRTMMGLAPDALASRLLALPSPPLAIGANCGVGASDTLAAILSITAAEPAAVVIAKANAGVPEVHDGHLHYSGTPEVMAHYACLAADAGARIIGGCCGTSPAHLAAMRRALDGHTRGERPSLDQIVAAVGRFVAPPVTAREPRERRGRRSQ